MNSAILKEALKVLKSDRARRENDQALSFQKLMSFNVYADLERKKRSLIIDIANFEVEEKNSSNLRSEYEELCSLQKSFAEQKKISVNSEPCCKKCLDSGFVNGLPCLCLKREMSKILLKKSGLEKLPKFEISTFHDVKLNETLQKWCESFPNIKKRSICLIGNTGTGKTFLTSCIVEKLIEKGHYVFFSTAFAMNNHFFSYHTTFDQNKISYLEPFLEADVLIIDDLGTENIINNVTIEYFYSVITERLSHGKATIITTNLQPEEIRERYGDRLFSRLMNKKEGLLLELKGNDLRLKK